MGNLNITEVHLLNVPLENDYKNTFYFSNRDNQYNYFKKNIVKSYTDFSYQRKDNVIRVPAHIDSLYKCNYVMYQNRAYSNKWFYCFIIDMKYINDNCTEIEISTDVMQTWMFDYSVKASFIEREHTNDDTIGNNTMSENLETGEYITKLYGLESELFKNKMDIVLATTVNPDTITSSHHDSVNGIYQGLPTGCKYYAYAMSEDSRNHDINELRFDLQNLTDNGSGDAIVGLFVAPQMLTDKSDGAISNSYYPSTIEKTYPAITDLDGYTPRNRKLLCYPYCMTTVSNGSGGYVELKPELWKTRTFHINGALTPGCSIVFIPVDYDFDGENNQYALPLGKLPQLSYSCDLYTNWCTENALNVSYAYLNGALDIISGGISSLALGSSSSSSSAISTGMSSVSRSAGGAEQISNAMYSDKLAQRVPPSFGGNVNSGDVNVVSNHLTFEYKNITIKKQFAKAIDSYFDMFGYKVNQVKVPNKNHRRRWWYTKTIDINIDGAIPNKDMQEIKDCYNNGITFWKNPSEIQNYSLSNEII